MALPTRRIGACHPLHGPSLLMDMVTFLGAEDVECSDTLFMLVAMITTLDGSLLGQCRSTVLPQHIITKNSDPILPTCLCHLLLTTSGQDQHGERKAPLIHLLARTTSQAFRSFTQPDQGGIILTRNQL